MLWLSDARGPANQEVPGMMDLISQPGESKAAETQTQDVPNRKLLTKLRRKRVS